MWYSKRRRAQNDQDFETWIEGGVCPTLNAFDNTGDSRATVLIIDGRRVDDVRVTTEPVYTLEARMGTGGNNVPMVAIPIQDGREMEKKQNGLGVGGEGDPAYTLDQTGAQAVAYSIREDATANTFSATEIETARSLSAVRPSVQSHHAQTFVTQVEEQLFEPTMQVRRLTPIECERLMGWPDNHTLHRADGGVNSDTARYKMCGNGVASPVAQWIAEQILPIHEAL